MGKTPLAVLKLGVMYLVRDFEVYAHLDSCSEWTIILTSGAYELPEGQITMCQGGRRTSTGTLSRMRQAILEAGGQTKVHGQIMPLYTCTPFTTQKVA